VHERRGATFVEKKCARGFGRKKQCYNLEDKAFTTQIREQKTAKLSSPTIKHGSESTPFLEQTYLFWTFSNCPSKLIQVRLLVMMRAAFIIRGRMKEVAWKFEL
jgi:hypothetical protein